MQVNLHLMNPHRRVHFQEPTATGLGNKDVIFCRNRKLITLFTRARDWTLFWANPSRPTLLHTNTRNDPAIWYGNIIFMRLSTTNFITLKEKPGVTSFTIRHNLVYRGRNRGNRVWRHSKTELSPFHGYIHRNQGCDVPRKHGTRDVTQ